MKALKQLFLQAPVLRKVSYVAGHAVIVTVDTSPIGIGWAISQENSDSERCTICFGAKILTQRQRKYPQIKRDMQGMVIAIKVDKNYLIGAEVVIETNYLPILGMISGLLIT